MGSSNVAALREAISSREPGSSSRIKPALLRLLSELKQRSISTASPDFFSEAMRAVISLKGHSLPDERLECFQIGVSVLTVSGIHRDAIIAAEAALSLAKAVRRPQSVRLAETLAGIARAEAGDVPKSIEHSAAALQIATALGDAKAQVVVLNNLGIAHNYAGLYRDAVPILQRAVDVMGADETLWEHRASVYCNLAQNHFSLGALIPARDAVLTSIQCSSTEASIVNSYNRAIRYSTLSRIMAALGDRDAARSAMEQCMAHATANGGARIAQIAAIAEALIEVRYGDTHLAITSLRKVIAASNATEEGEAYPILIAAYDEASKPELALDTLRSYLANLRRLRKATLEVLLKKGICSPSGASGESDLQHFAFEENRLRAAVAERELILAQLETLERLAISADLREESSGEHGFRVGTLTRMICEQLGHTKAESYSAEVAARLHDLGKISLPDRIMLRPGALAEVERQFVCAHTRVGAELLSNGRSPELQLAQAIALHHHEWWNGAGYPSKLSGTRIPIHARIVALADVFDALTHGRPYAPAWPVEKALAEIRSRRGTQFDPELTDVFLNLMERLVNEHEDLDAYLGRESRHSPFLQARNKIRQMLEAERENEKKATVEGNLTRH